MSYFTKRGKTHLVEALDSLRALCGLSTEKINNVTIHKENVTCAKCLRMMGGGKIVEVDDPWEDYSLSCPGRRSHSW